MTRPAPVIRHHHPAQSTPEGLKALTAARAYLLSSPSK